jgi:hypothetical protein
LEDALRKTTLLLIISHRQTVIEKFSVNRRPIAVEIFLKLDAKLIITEVEQLSQLDEPVPHPRHFLIYLNPEKLGVIVWTIEHIPAICSSVSGTGSAGASTGG